jgi:GalNAc-alpha-(1->4)-GalNAc-alpha-(1->3)-diNAcBac-PP-undecaprenol alpha-1,4-N-acetyl-D-galactosaminyltransferase
MTKNNITHKKICLVIPSLQAGGMERVMTQLLDSFSCKPDLEIHLILYGINQDIFYAIPDNINIHYPDFVFNNDKRFFSTLKTLFFLRSKIYVIKPYSILSFGEYWNSLVLISLLGTKNRVFVSDRCQPNKSLGKIHDALRRYLYPLAAGVIAQTSQAKEIYLNLFKNKNIKVIGNPITIHKHTNKTVRENIILSVGRLIDSKNYDRLIRMFSEMDTENWKLVILGGDALKQKNLQKLRAMVIELGMEHKIELMGTVFDPETYYRKSKIFAFTSSSEGFPNVIGEALSNGLPVISYNCIAGPTDLINDAENGFLIDVFDDENYKKQLTEMMTNNILWDYLHNNTVDSVKKYSKESIAQEYYNFICA